MLMQFKNPEILQKLEKSGFTIREAKVYLATLELGGAFPSKIAEYAGINRSTTYAILQNLAARGLVNEIQKKNKLFYQIEKPEKLLNYAQTQISLAEVRLENARTIIPDIEGLYGALTDQPKVRYFEGTDGMMDIYRDMIGVEKKYEMLAWSNAKQLEQVFPAKFFEEFRRTKERNGITTRGIIPDTLADRAYNEKFFTGYQKKIVPRFRYVAAEQFPFKGEITIYGENRVAIVNLNKEYLTGIIIEDRTIHDMMRLAFELSWESRNVGE